MNRSSSISPRSDPRAGFTLIEVLAGLFVTGLFLLTVMPFMMRLIGVAWSGETNMMTGDQWMQASARLAADFGEAIPLSIGDDDKPRLAFRAAPDRVEFIHRSLSGDRDHLEIVTLAIESGSAGQSIVRSAVPFSKQAFTSDSDADDQGEQTALLKTPYGLQFKVLDADGKPLAASSNFKELPSEVELDVDGPVPDIPFVFPIAARSSPSAAAGPNSAH